MADWIIAKIERQDIARCAAINLACFEHSEINRYCRPPHLRLRNATPEQREAANHARFSSRLQDIAMMAVHPESGQIAATAVWVHPKPTRREAAQLLETPAPLTGKQEVDPEVDPVASGIFRTWVEERRCAIVGEETHWYLVSLATDPAFQKQGAAKALVDWGLGQAKEAGLRTLVHSVPAAMPFYQMRGFQTVETITLPYMDRDERGAEQGERQIELRVMIHEKE